MDGNTSLRIGIQDLGPDTVVIHLNCKVGDMFVSDFASDPIEQKMALQAGMYLGELTCLFKDIRQIRGVTFIEGKGYSIFISKGALFDWDDILPQVMSFLSLHFNDGEAVECEEVSTPDMFGSYVGDFHDEDVEEVPKKGKIRRLMSWIKRVIRRH